MTEEEEEEEGGECLPQRDIEDGAEMESGGNEKETERGKCQ